MLTIIFGRDILLLGPNETEKELRVSPLIRSIRMDVVFMDEENVLYRYTFRAVSEEVPECSLDDKATRIFLNTKGKNEKDVPRELVEFLHYVKNSTDEAAGQSESERIKRIHDCVCKLKLSEKAGVKYEMLMKEMELEDF